MAAGAGPRAAWRTGGGAISWAMILLIDNYDSFTYNLVHFLGDLGAKCVVHRNDQITVEEAMAL